MYILDIVLFSIGYIFLCLLFSSTEEESPAPPVSVAPCPVEPAVEGEEGEEEEEGGQVSQELQDRIDSLQSEKLQYVWNALIDS